MHDYEVFDSRYAKMLTELSRYSCINMKAKFYIPRTQNPELDDTIIEVLERALKGYVFLESSGILQDITVEELHRRGFTVECLELLNYHIIQW